MQMLQSDWLSHWTLSIPSVQCLGVVDKIVTFPRCSGVSKEHLETNRFIK